MYTYTHTYIHIYIYMYRHVCMYIHTYMYTYIYIYTYIYMYTQTHTHTHTHTHLASHNHLLPAQTLKRAHILLTTRFWPLHNNDSFIYTHPYQRQRVRSKVEDNDCHVCSEMIIIDVYVRRHRHLTIYLSSVTVILLYTCIHDNHCQLYVYSKMTMIVMYVVR